MRRRRGRTEQRSAGCRRALLGVLAVLAAIGLIGMHGLVMSMAPTPPRSSAAMPDHLVMHHGAEGVASSREPASDSPVALIAPRGCGADHGSCVAALRAQAQLDAPAEVAWIAAPHNPQPSTDQMRWVAAARGPPVRPPGPHALGISRT